MTNLQLAEIKNETSILNGEEKTKYLSGVRAGLDFAQSLDVDLYEDSKMASNEVFRELLGFLDEES